ncbi:MAG: hypothetical protein KDD58_15900 [Bdellovibrionales bacterium]|nr:hypothetical protein [Bdellovibrionales bacterium]
MKNVWIALLSFIILLVSSACSTNWKEGSSNITEDELFEDLTNMFTSAAAGCSSDSGLYSSLLDDSDTIIYYARSGTPEEGGLGPAYSVVSFGDYSVLSCSSENDIGIYDLKSSRVALFDGYDADGYRRFVLAVNYQLIDGQGVSFVAADDDFKYSDGRLQIYFKSGQRQVFIETFDVVESGDGFDLKGKIHLKMVETTNGVEELIGQFSFLEGFGK